MAQPTENVPVKPFIQPDKNAIDYPDGPTIVEAPHPKLSVLTGDRYSRSDFATLNDSEFTELISSIEGIGIDEFFSLYEELKDTITPGTLQIGFDTSGLGPKDTLNLINESITLLENGDTVGFAANMDKLSGMISALTDVIGIGGATPKTHAWLVQYSVPYVKELSERFKALFNLLVDLLKRNADLQAQVDALTKENEELKKLVKELNDLILKLTAPEVVGFQIFPDLFTVDTVPGGLWKVGDPVRITVCGSAAYTMVPQKGYTYQELNWGDARRQHDPFSDVTQTFRTDFAWSQIPETSTWEIYTNPATLVGKTVYITAESAEMTAAGKPTEQIVFVFPGTPIIPPGGGGGGTPYVLLVNPPIDSTIALILPVSGPRDETKATDTVTVYNGHGPYTAVNNVSDWYYSITSIEQLVGNNSVKVSLSAIKNGRNAHALTIRDNDGVSIDIEVIVNSEDVSVPYVPKDVYIQESITVESPSLTTAYITSDEALGSSTGGGGGGTGGSNSLAALDVGIGGVVLPPGDGGHPSYDVSLREIIAVGTDAGAHDDVFTINRNISRTYTIDADNVKRVTEEIQIVPMGGVGQYDMIVTGGPRSQTYTDDTGIIWYGAKHFILNVQ